MRSKAFRPAVAAVLLVLPAVSSHAENRVEKTLKLAPGGSLRLNTDLGSVSVTGKSAPDVRIVITSRRNLEDLMIMHFEEGSGSVTITGRRKHRFFFVDFGEKVHYEIETPAETALDIHTSGGRIAVAAIRSRAKLNTSGGGIEVRDHVGDLDADTSGGSIRVNDIRGRMRVETSGGGIDGTKLDGNLHAETSGGSITLKGVTGDIHASTSGGGIRIAEAGGRVEAETSGGSIEASFAKGNARGGSFETSDGGIEVAVDPEAGFEIDAEGNSVKTELPVRVVGEISRRSLKGSIGRGGALLRLRTSGGGVRIKPL